MSGWRKIIHQLTGRDRNWTLTPVSHPYIGVAILSCSLLFFLVVVVRAFTFNWMPSAESERVDIVIKLHLEKNFHEKLEGGAISIPLTRKYTSCRQWMFEDLWSDCIAIWVDPVVLTNDGISKVKDALSKACSLVDWGEDVSHPMVDWGGQTYREMRSFFSCGQPASRQSQVNIYTHSSYCSAFQYVETIQFMH